MYYLVVSIIIQDNPTTLSFREQPALEFSLTVPISPDDDLRLFLDVCSKIDFYQYIHEAKSNHRCSCSRVRLLMTILFGYTVMDNCSLRKLENLCRYDIRFLWLSDYKEPSFLTFKRVLDEVGPENFQKLTQEITKRIVEENEVDTDTVYIDGTKLQANAGRYTFVYRKRIEKGMLRKNPYISQLLINSEYADPSWIRNEYSADDLDRMCCSLWKRMKEEGITPVYGRGHRKTVLQRLYDELHRICEKYAEYEEQLGIMGEDRNSYSKSDHDATFMCLKKDFYLRNGITTPAYNIQIGVSDGFILYSLVNQDRSDSRSWISTMEIHRKIFGTYPTTPVADAGYGSLENYQFNKEHGIELVQKYNYYDKKQEPSFKKDIFNRFNWPKDQAGFYICPQKRIFNVLVFKSGSKRVYREAHRCNGCPLREECTSAKRGRTLTDNPELAAYQQEVDERFETQEGQWLLSNRQSQVEGAFGILKNNHYLERFKYRGLKKVTMEMLLYQNGFNLRKHFRMSRKGE